MGFLLAGWGGTRAPGLAPRSRVEPVHRPCQRDDRVGGPLGALLPRPASPAAAQMAESSPRPDGTWKIGEQAKAAGTRHSSAADGCPRRSLPERAGARTGRPRVAAARSESRTPRPPSPPFSRRRANRSWPGSLAQLGARAAADGASGLRRALSRRAGARGQGARRCAARPGRLPRPAPRARLERLPGAAAAAPSRLARRSGRAAPRSAAAPVRSPRTGTRSARRSTAACCGSPPATCWRAPSRTACASSRISPTAASRPRSPAPRARPRSRRPRCSRSASSAAASSTSPPTSICSSSTRTPRPSTRSSTTTRSRA